MTAIPEEIKAMGFTEAKSEVKQITYKPKPMGKYDTDIKVTYNGICHTDVHMIDNDWGMSRYPLVPGHEVVGHVVAVGSEITDLKVGDVVGLGCICQCCQTCDYCKKGLDNICSERRFTYFGSVQDETGEYPHHGGFGSFIRTDGRQLFKIPNGYPELLVGPLMCAGATVWEPIRHFFNGTDGAGKSVGVVGLGGLGHLAVQFAAKMGADVYALSRGTGKADFAKQLGAKGLIDTTDDEAVKKAAGSLDLLVITISGCSFDVNKYVGLLRPYGNMHFCGVPSEDLKFNVMPFIFGRLTLSGNPVGGKADMRQMLDFAAKNDVKPIVEEFTHTQAAEALKKVRDGSVRFRAVLKNDL